MRPLDPGTPCWLRDLPELLEGCNGRAVTVRHLWDHDDFDDLDDELYRVDATWISEATCASGMVVSRVHLLPMAGPGCMPYTGWEQLDLLDCLPPMVPADAVWAPALEVSP